MPLAAAPIFGVAVILLITPGLLFYFDITPKVATLLIAVAVMLIPASRFIPGLWREHKSRWFLILLAGQFASLMLATAFSTDPALSIGGSNWRRMGLISHTALLLFALCAAVAGAGSVLTTLRAISIAGIVAAIYGCAQYAGWDPLLPSASYHVGEGEWTIVRPPSTLGYASYAATFYLHAVFAGLALAGAAGGWWKRIGAAAAALCSVAIVLSGTRAAMLGLGVGLVLLFAAARPKPRPIHGALAVGVLLAGVAFYYSPPGQKLRSRTRWFVEDSRGGPRLWLWRDAAAMGASRWATGWGPEVFPVEFPHLQSAELARAYPDFYHESPHNVYLEAWTAQGLPGFGILLGLTALALSQFRQSAFLCAGLAAALVAQQFTSFTLATALCFYWNVATVTCRASSHSRQTSVRLSLLPAAAFLAYALALLVSDRLQLSTSRHLAAGRLREAIGTYERARQWQPPGVTSDLWFSRALFEAARKSSRVVEAAEAIRVSAEAATRAALHAEDRANAAYSLAVIQSAQGNANQVEASLRMAIRYAPHWYKPHWTLAKLLLMTGRRGEASAEIDRAAGLGGAVHPEVQQTQKEVRSQE
jgi:O-antigen ligase